MNLRSTTIDALSLIAATGCSPVWRHTQNRPVGHHHSLFPQRSPGQATAFQAGCLELRSFVPLCWLHYGQFKNANKSLHKSSHCCVTTCRRLHAFEGHPLKFERKCAIFSCGLQITRGPRATAGIVTIMSVLFLCQIRFLSLKVISNLY